MLYSIYGTQKFLIERTLKGYVKKILNNDINELNYKRIDFDSLSFDDLKNEISLLPFGYDKKVISVFNAINIFKNKDEVEKILQLINDCNDNVDVFFIINDEKLDRNLFADVKDKLVIEAKNLSDDEWMLYIEKYFEKNNSSISKDAALELKKRCSNDVEKLNSELYKLITFSNTITMKDLDLLVNEPLEDNSFNIMVSLLDDNKNTALKIYKDLLKKNVEPVVLVSILASQFKFLNEVSYLNSQKMSKDDIAKKLKVSSGRIYYSLKSVKRCSKEIINDTMNKLYNLDKGIKSGEIDRFLALELFILNFRSKNYEMSNL